jgi:predicted esterase
MFPVPIKIWHGIADPSIPYQISEEYAVQIKRAGVDCRLRLIAGVGHGSSATMKTELPYWFNRFN